MKVCVGDRTFDDNIIGTARDALRSCIDEELSQLANNFGLEIQNVVVPEVILSPEVLVALDAIVQSRLETEKAAQDKLRAEAQAEAEQARQEGEIRIEQSRIQEQAKQQTTLALLEEERILAQKAVIEAERANELAKVEAERAIIEAQKTNELLAAERDLEINQAKALAAAEKAKADLAVQVAQAEIYAQNPGYLNLQMVTANASALQNTDKIIFTPEGTVPTLVVPGPGIVPTVETGAASTTATVQPAVVEEGSEAAAPEAP
jgi:regulator of protease activity HflC (stomatin/prohibitin superfamily)